MIDRIINTLAVIALTVLIFLTGFSVAFFKIGPYETLHKGFKGLWAANYLNDSELTASHFIWPKANAYIGKQGVTKYNAYKTYGDYTLYSPSTQHAAYLIDMTGNIIHSWSMPFSKTWNNLPHISNPVPDHYIYWQGLHLFPNGDLLAVYYAIGAPNGGYGVIKLDKNSNVVWTYAGHAHHDLSIDNNGNVFTLTQKILDEGIDAIDHLSPPLFDEYITLISKDGKHIKDISIYQAFTNSEYFKYVMPYLSLAKRNDIELSFTRYGDVIHPNFIYYITEEIENLQPAFKKGHLLISLREIDTLALIDPKTEIVTWAKRGFWRTQHSPIMNDQGNIVLFDNQGPQDNEQKSRIIEYNPANHRIVWSYKGNDSEPFYSSIRSDVQALPNGNVLVTEYENGRIFEITKDKKIVWEFFTSESLKSDPSRVAGIHKAMRYAKNELPFLLEK